MKQHGIRDYSSASSESVVFSVFPLVRESDYTKNENEVHHLRQGSSYRTSSGGIGLGSTNLKSSSVMPGRNCEVVVEDFTLEDKFKHVTIMDTAEIIDS